MKISAIARLMAAAALLAGAAAAHAEAAYPDRPIRMIIPYAPGGSLDPIGRVLGEELSRRLQQPVVVENVAGASGMLGANRVAKANPDGYTLLATSSGPLAVNGWIYKNLRYDSRSDFQPLAMIGIFPLVLVVNPASRFNSVADLVEYARQHPGAVNYASGGNGVTNHLVMEMFQQRAGVKLNHIPYKGGVAAMTDVVGGQVDVMFEVASIAEPLVRSGKLRALAVASEHRVATLANVPTIAESGYAGFRGDPWIGVVGPKDLPQPVVDKLAGEIVRIARKPQWTRRMAELGAIPQVMEPAQFGAFIGAEVERWGEAVKAANAKAE